MLDFDGLTGSVMWAYRLHDIGKLALDSALYNHPAPLSSHQWQAMRRHPAIGAAMVEQLPDLAYLAAVIRHHHERWDGGGYPAGLATEEIPLGARIVAVVDAFDAMVWARSYRHPATVAEARGEIRRHAGSQFDPEVVNAFELASDRLVASLD